MFMKTKYDQKSEEIAYHSEYYHHGWWKDCDFRTRCIPTRHLNTSHLCINIFFFAIVVIINLEETIIVNLLQIDIHHGQGN